MFQISRFFSSNSNAVSSSQAFSGSGDNIRTLKDDLQKFKEGRQTVEEGYEADIHPNNPPIPQPITPEKIKASPIQPFQKEFVPMPLKVPTFGKTPVSTSNQAAPKEEILNPFGSDTYFKNQSPFDEKNSLLRQEPEKNFSKPKSSKIFVSFLSILLILALMGGGVYYWWFFVKTPAQEEFLNDLYNNLFAKTPATETKLANSQSAENSSLKKWSLDPMADKIANKLAIERKATELTASVSEGKVVEIKVISTENQPIAPQKFAEIFDFQLPISVSEKLTGDYSLFFTKENGGNQLGAAFKLSQSENLTESLKSEEGSFFSNLKSFYLNKAPSNSEVVFLPSKYIGADIRYFNFPGNSGQSLYYSVLPSKESSYFIFSTSKKSFRAILDYMSEK